MTARRATRTALALAMLVALAATAVAAVRVPEARRHRLTLPPGPSVAPTPPPPVVLPSILAVDEREWSVGLSRALVAAGDVTFRIFNRGMDDHDLAVVDADGVRRKVDIPAGGDRTMAVRLAPGTVKVFCSLFEGTPASHESAGMVAYLEVR